MNRRINRIATSRTSGDSKSLFPEIHNEWARLGNPFKEFERERISALRPVSSDNGKGGVDSSFERRRRKGAETVGRKRDLKG